MQLTKHYKKLREMPTNRLKVLLGELFCDTNCIEYHYFLLRYGYSYTVRMACDYILLNYPNLNYPVPRTIQKHVEHIIKKNADYIINFT